MVFSIVLLRAKLFQPTCARCKVPGLKSIIYMHRDCFFLFAYRER